AMAMAAWVAAATLIMAASAWRAPAAGPLPSLALLQGALAVSAALGPPRWVLRNAWQSLRRGILNDHVLAAAAALAGIAGGLGGLWRADLPSGAFFAASVYVLAFHAIGGYASVLVHVRASQAVRRLLALQPETASRLGSDGAEEEVPVEALRPGDRVLIRPGQRVPVDGVVVSGGSAVDLQLVTGEAIPRDCGPGDEVVGGSLNLTGTLVVEVSRVGEQTFLRQVARQVARARAMKPGVLRLVDRILLGYVPAVFALAAAAGLFWVLWPLATGGAPDVTRAAFALLGTLIMGYPCALGMATPLAIVRTSGEAATRGILMRSGEAFHLLRSVDVVVLDKTGTITEGRPRVVAVHAAGGDPHQLLALAASAEQRSEHPLARAIVQAAGEQGLRPSEPDRLRAVPGRGVVARVRGQEVLAGTSALLSEHGVPEEPDVMAWAQRQRELGRTVIFVAHAGRTVGAVALADRVKPEAAGAVTELQRQGLEVVMATGDDERVARAVAAEAGISRVHAGLLPGEKQELVRSLQAGAHRVAFVGDGINDAPALMQADVGVAIGSGTDIAIESADVVLTGSRLDAVPEARRLAAASYGLTVRNVTVALAFNAAGMLASVTGRLHPGWAMLAMTLSLGTVLVSSSVLPMGWLGGKAPSARQQAAKSGRPGARG
ncbi:MAG: cation-translocating P-type ATPase, partial [Firmicutes bacterium]|nr:cation-translocating P-type ATPase [Bacillota bacterium]